MKKLVFLLSFLLTFSVFAEDPKRGGEDPQDSVYTQPCSLKNSPLNLIATLSNELDRRHNKVNGETTYRDTDNSFPAVGMVNLYAGGRGISKHGSGTLLALKDEKGNVLRNKVVTSAHNIFDSNGNLDVPIESIQFLLGQDVNNEDYKFNIKKIECPELWKDQCILTLDKDVPKEITPMTPVSDPEPYVNSADMYYFVGYPDWVPDFNGRTIGKKGERFYSECNSANRWRGNNGEDLYMVGCNAFAGNSGGAFLASKKQPNGTWKDYYIGMVGGLGAKGQNNLADTFRYNEVSSFNSIVITTDNQRQFFASN